MRDQLKTQIINQAWANRRSQIFLIQKNSSKLKGVIYLW